MAITALKDINAQASKDILSLDWVLNYIQVNMPVYQVKAVTPASYTIGSNNHSEGLESVLQIENSIFFGRLQLDVNPNGNAFAADNITMLINSLLNPTPYTRHLNRIIEIQNYLNEQTERIELFDRLEITSTSTLYDTYLTFIGFKIDVN